MIWTSPRFSVARPIDTAQRVQPSAVRFYGDPPTHCTFPALEALGLPHAVTTRHCPGVAPPSDPVSPFSPPSHALSAPLGLDLSRTAYLRQVHGSDVALVDGYRGGFAGSGDILVTRTPELPLAIFTADCLGIILFDPGRRLLAVAHVGWRGTVKGAAGAAAAALVREGARPADLIAAIATQGYYNFLSGKFCEHVRRNN